MHRISLIAVDLDGTLLTSEGLLAPEGASLIRRASRDGVRVIVATTRNPESVQPFCQSLELEDPIICVNGAHVLASPLGPIWEQRAIPSEAASMIARMADLHGWELSTTVGSITYWRRRPGQEVGPYAPNISIVATNAEAVIGDPKRILVHKEAAIERIQQFCRTNLADQCHTELFLKPDGSPYSLAVFARGANKGAALAVVLERLGIDCGGVMAIGDNLNDVSMFALARVSVAMGNAPRQVKEAALAVAPSNDEEGVAWALKRFVPETA